MTCPDGYNDPAVDSLFDKIDGKRNRCRLCGVEVDNCTEARDGHLNAVGIDHDRTAP